MKIKNKNNLIEQNKDIQKPDLNILKIDDVIKNEKLPSKYAFKKNNRNSSKQMNKFSENNLLINSDVDIGNNINNKNTNYSPKEDSKSSFVYRLKTDLDKSKTAYNNFDNSDKIININEYKSKYKGMEIKSDEDYNKLSQIHEELIDEILKGEDEFIDAHKSHIDNMVEYIKKEMKFIHEVDKPGSDIEEYTNNLDKLLAQEIQTITNLRKKLVKFHIMIKDENALANLFGEDEKFSENGFEGGESTNSLEEFFISKEEMNKKAGTNINYNNKYNFQSKKK
jgi:hypothetical protein